MQTPFGGRHNRPVHSLERPVAQENPIPSNPSRYTAAIVDLDGTMVDTLGDFQVALNAAMADLGLERVDREFIEHTIGKGSEHLVRQTLAAVGAPEGRFDEAFERYQHHYERINGKYADVYDGVIEGLVRLQAHGLALACLTNKPVAFARGLLEMKGLAPFFQTVSGGDSFERKKPDPLPVTRTCEALGSEPSRTLVIGDSVNDATAARAAGCPVVLVRYGYNHGQPVAEVDCDGTVDRLDAIDLG